MMRTKVGVILSILVAACWAPWAHGGIPMSGADCDFKKGWGWGQTCSEDDVSAGMQTCRSNANTNISDATIGAAKDTCKGWSAGGKVDACKTNSDDYGVMLLVARQVNANGAEFCPTVVYGERSPIENKVHWRGAKRERDAVTYYSDPEGGHGTCFWLCKNGYGGTECQQTVNAVTTCDSTTLTRDMFNDFNMLKSASSNIEDSIPMLSANNPKRCGDTNGLREHDVILAVTGWLASGHGAWVAPVTVSALREYENPTGGVDIYISDGMTRVLVCKNGYEATNERNECKPIDASRCEGLWPCDGYRESDYKPDTMNWVYDSDNNCHRYVCKEPGQAFASGASLECTACVENMRNGVSPADGTCVTCDVGQVFDKNAESTGYCTSATAYTKTDMQYGAGKTRATSGDLDTQCWTISDIDQYKACVANGGATSLASGTLSRALPATAVQYKFAQTETKLDLSAPTTVQTSVYATPANQTSLTVPAVSQQLQQAVSAVN